VSLTAADVAQIMRLVEESGFDELTLEMDGIKLSLRRGAAPEISSPGASAASAATPGLAVTPSPAAPIPTISDPNIQAVTAPLLGTFYRSPKPGAPPFVEIGATVEEDTVIAIIEVMKLMNSVRAGVRGTVTEILPADGSLVEYGATLLRVRKPG
jgi:acetyl-CoA carboxylase biotin carboxyl carrier protein